MPAAELYLDWFPINDLFGDQWQSFNGSIHAGKIQVALRPKWFVESHQANSESCWCVWLFTVEASIENRIYSRSPGRSCGFWVRVAYCLVPYLDYRSDCKQHPFGLSIVFANVLTCPRVHFIHLYFEQSKRKEMRFLGLEALGCGLRIWDHPWLFSWLVVWNEHISWNIFHVSIYWE